MTPEELQQIQAIIQAAVAPLATKQEIQTLKTEMNNRFDQLEKLTADYLDGEVQKVKRRVDRIERHLNLI
jgi:hypothetical protein